MATSIEYIRFVCEQIQGNYDVRYKKMFGDYMVYLNDKPVLLVCDNCAFVKKVQELAEILKDAECGYPYVGAKEWYVLDIENSDLTQKVLAILEMITPLPVK